MPEPDGCTEQVPRETAYFIWEHEGRPEGCAEDHWERATKAKAESEAGAPLMIEGQTAGRNGVMISVEPISCIVMPWNARGPSPHAPGYDLDDDAALEIAPVPQDGSGRTMSLLRSVIAELHATPFEHLPVHLTADGETVPPQAATDLWARVQAHNKWLTLAYPAMIDQPRPTCPVLRSEIIPPDDGGDDSPDGEEPPPADYMGWFGRP
jgi:DUF2934 family protein